MGLTGELIVKDKEGKVIERGKKKLLTLPRLTDRNTMIYNGSEYAVMNQMRLRPGVYTTIGNDGIARSQFNVSKGVGYDIWQDPINGFFYMQFGQSSIPLYPVLKESGLTDEAISKSWGKDLFKINKDISQKKYDGAVLKAYNKLTRSEAKGLTPTIEDARVKLKEVIDLSQLDPTVTRQTLGAAYKSVTPDVILEASKKVSRVSKREAPPDDRESLAYKSIHGLDDLLKESITRGSLPITWKIKNRLDSMYNNTPGEILNKSFPSGSLSSPIYTTINSSPLVQLISDANPVSLLTATNKLTSFGPGGISQVYAIPDEIRNMHLSHVGFLDPIAMPRTEKSGIDLQMGIGVKRAGGTLTAKFLDKKGKAVRLSPGNLHGKVIALPGQEKQKGKLEAIKDGLLIHTDRSKIDYTLFGSNRMFANQTVLSPFLSNSAGDRANMAGNMAAQALPLKYREQPLVQTESDIAGQTNEEIVGNKFSVLSQADGVVSDLRPTYIEVTDKAGNKHKAGMYSNYPVGNKTFTNHESIVSIGQSVKKNQVIADSNYTKGGVLSLGTNLRTIYIPYKGMTFEDGIVVSDGAAKKLTSEHLFRYDVPLDEDTEVKRNKWLAYFANKVDKTTIKHIGEDGVISVGTELSPGDYMVTAMKYRETKPEDVALGRLSKKLMRPYGDMALVWDKPVKGKVIDVVRNPKSITVTVRADAPLVVGDKLTNRIGGKGVVTAVLSDSEMPKDKDGKSYDIILNPATVMSRMNIGQLLETAASKLGSPGKPYVAQQFPRGKENISKTIKDELSKRGLSETEMVYDANGKKIGHVFAGNQYFYKLFKTTDVNYSARAFQGKFDADKAPLPGGDEGSKGIGMLDMYALLSHNARNILRESVTTKAEDNPEFLKALQMGMPLPAPKSTFAFEKFINYIKGAGINVERKGDRFKLLPLTDKDVSKMSYGPIGDAKMLRSKDQKEEPGGLFDVNITGGRFGQKWAHIDLAEPILNPVFVEPVRRLLGLKERELLDMQYKYGGQAIADKLKLIDVDKKIGDINNKINDYVGAKRDDLYKQLKYLKVLKDAGMSPADAYIIQKVPIIPPVFRPIYNTGIGNETRVSDVNNLYKQVISVNNGMKMDFHKYTGDIEKEGLRRELFSSIMAVQGLDKPVTGHDYKGFIMKIKGNTPKEGYFQSKLMKKQQNIAGRSTIGGDPTLDLDDAKIPEDMAWTLYGPFVVRDMVRNGMTVLQAKEEIEKRTDQAKVVLRMAMKERPILLNRAPTLHKYNIMAFNPIAHKDTTILIPPMVMRVTGSDVDGDSVSTSVYCIYNFQGGRMPFTGETKIRHIYGVVNLRDFPRGELIEKTENKEVYKVPKKIKALTVMNGVEQWLPIESFSIHKNLIMNEVTTSSFRTVQCSDDHSLITVDDNLDYVKSKAIIGMTIPRLRKPVSGNIEVIKEIDIDYCENGKYEFKAELMVDGNLGYFTGAFIGNGWVNGHTGRKSAIHFASMEASVVKKLGEILSSYCDEKIHTYSLDTTHDPFDKKDVKHSKHTWHSKRIACYLEEHIGMGAKNKHLPLFWMHTSEEFRWGLLAGLIDTDGSVGINSAMRTRPSIQYSIAYTTVSRALAHELVALAHTLNLTASVSYGTTPLGGECYNVYFSQESILISQSKLKLEDQSKSARLAAFKPGKFCGKNKYTPFLSKVRLQELRCAILEEAKKYGYSRKIPIDAAMARKCINMYCLIGGNRKSHSILSRPTALNIFDLNLDLFTSDPFWVKWKQMVLDERIDWEIITDIKPLPFLTEAYDLTIPPAYTMVTDSGIIVQDTMVVHVPVTEEARREAATKMRPSQNLFAVLDKSPNYSPSNESVFGLFLGTKHRDGVPIKSYNKEHEVLNDIEHNKIQPTDIIEVNGVRTTPGSVQINGLLPHEFRDLSRTITKKSLAEILSNVGTKYPDKYKSVAHSLKDFGDKWALSQEASLSFKDFEFPEAMRDKLFVDAEAEIASKPGKTTGVDIINAYDKANTRLMPELIREGKKRDNKFYEWSASGSRGSPHQFAAIWGAPVLVTGLGDKVTPYPIKHNFIEGLTHGEYLASLYGTRKGIVDSKLEVSEPGAMAKEITASSIDMVVSMRDCGTRRGLDLDLNNRDVLERMLAVDVHGKSGGVIARRNHPVDSRLIDLLKHGGVTTIKVRSPITCEAPKGVCAMCVGIEETGKVPEVGDNIGTKYSTSMSEPLTQMALSSKHTSGIGKSRSLSYIKNVLRMPENIYTREVLAGRPGAIESVVKSPSGGHILSIKEDRGGVKEYIIPSGLDILKNKGSVEAGESLSSGTLNIPGYVGIMGIEQGRKKMVGAISDFYQSHGRYIDKRVPEVLARSILNYEQVIHPGDYEYVPGDIVEHNQVQHMQKKLITKVPINNLLGYRLAYQYRDISPGTLVDHSIITRLKHDRISAVDAYKEPVTSSPVVTGVTRIPVKFKDDWLARMGFRYLEDALVSGAATGATSSIHSMNPIPALAYGAEFGKGLGVDVY